MRNDLHRGAEIRALPLFAQHVPVHFTGGQVGEFVQVFVDKALVVPKVQIGLRPVLGHINLAVLVRAHRAGVHIDVRIQFLRRNFQPARFEQPPEGRCGNALAKTGNHTAGHENVLCLLHIYSPSFLLFHEKNVRWAA